MDNNAQIGNVITVYRQVVMRYSIRRAAAPQAAPQLAPSVAPQELPKVQKGNPCINAVSILIIYALSIFLIAQGGRYMKDCPAKTNLPTIMVVLGAFLLVARLFNYIFDCKSVFGDEDEYDVPAGLRCMNLLFQIVSFALWITLCVYSFSLDPTTKPEDQGSSNYCDRALYLSGYWVSIGFLVIFGLGFCCICCVVCQLSSNSQESSK